MKIEPIDFLEFQTNRGALIAAFKPSSNDIWKEDSATEKIDPVKICDGWEYMPWGIDNQMPFDILEKIEADETLNTCQQHNIKNCYAAGLEYVVPEDAGQTVRDEVAEDIGADVVERAQGEGQEGAEVFAEGVAGGELDALPTAAQGLGHQVGRVLVP